jgi:hypothetical protein
MVEVVESEESEADGEASEDAASWVGTAAEGEASEDAASWVEIADAEVDASVGVKPIETPIDIPA